MTKATTHSGDWKSRTTKNTANLAFWTALWLATLALATFGYKFLWADNTLLSMLAIGLNIAVGIGMILANKRHLKGLDEMHQKVQLEAMGLALGAGLVGGFAYALLDTTNVISHDAELSLLIGGMGLVYLAAVIIGVRRYA